MILPGSATAKMHCYRSSTGLPVDWKHADYRVSQRVMQSPVNLRYHLLPFLMGICCHIGLSGFGIYPLRSPGTSGTKYAEEALFAISKVAVQDVHGLAILAIVLDNNTRASNNLSGIAFTVNLAQANPLSELFGVLNLDKIDIVFVAEGFNELEVILLSAGLYQHTKVGLSSRHCKIKWNAPTGQDT